MRLEGDRVMAATFIGALPKYSDLTVREDNQWGTTFAIVPWLSPRQTALVDVYYPDGRLRKDGAAWLVSLDKHLTDWVVSGDFQQQP